MSIPNHPFLKVYKRKPLLAVLVVGATLIAGYYVIPSLAQDTFSFALNSSQMSVSGSAQHGSDPEASDGEYIVFGAEKDPAATFSYQPHTPLVGETVTFDGSGSTCSAEPCSYEWADVINGGEWELGSGQTLEFTFAGAGEKHVRLRLTDNHGESDETVQIITVEEAPDDDGDSDPPDDGSGGSTETDGSLREGFGGSSRPSGDEYAVPGGYPLGAETGFAASDLSREDLEETGSITVTEDGAIIEGVHTSSIRVSADNVTIRDSIIEGSSLYSINAYSDNQSGLRVERTDIHQTDPCRKALYARNAEFHNVNAWGGDTVAVFRSNVRVTDSFLHDPSTECSGRHYDVMHSQGAVGLHVKNSTLLGRWQNQTAALIAQSNQSQLRDLRLENSFLSGGTFTVYVRERNYGAPRDITVTNNLWQADSWQFGPTSLNCGSGWSWSGNTTTAGATVEGC